MKYMYPKSVTRPNIAIIGISANVTIRMTCPWHVFRELNFCRITRSHVRGGLYSVRIDSTLGNMGQQTDFCGRDPASSQHNILVAEPKVSAATYRPIPRALAKIRDQTIGARLPLMRNARCCTQRSLMSLHSGRAGRLCFLAPYD